MNQLALPKIGKTLVIASGKGGVGKTTVIVYQSLTQRGGAAGWVDFTGMGRIGLPAD